MIFDSTACIIGKCKLYFELNVNYTIYESDFCVNGSQCTTTLLTINLFCWKKFHLNSAMPSQLLKHLRVTTFPGLAFFSIIRCNSFKVQTALSPAMQNCIQEVVVGCIRQYIFCLCCVSHCATVLNQQPEKCRFIRSQISVSLALKTPLSVSISSPYTNSVFLLSLLRCSACVRARILSVFIVCARQFQSLSDVFTKTDPGSENDCFIYCQVGLRKIMTF